MPLAGQAIRTSFKLRLHFQERLEEIQSDVVRMGSEALDMVRLAVDATINGDLDAASRVMSLDDRVDALERDIMNKAVRAVMQEAPVAADLRFLISVIGVVSEIERVGDDAVKLARRARKLQDQFPTELKIALVELSELARRSFSSSMRLICTFSFVQASEIVEGDHEIDQAYSAARDRVFELIRRNPDATEDLVRTIEAFHALEHVADHAVGIALRMTMLHSPVLGE